MSSKSIMTVQELTCILQNYCHEGGSLDRVEIYDKEGRKFCYIDKVELERSDEEEICKITVHENIKPRLDYLMNRKLVDKS